MKPYYEDDAVKLYHGDCREVVESLPDDSVHLVATDPPCFKVIDHDFDHQWDKLEDFLVWLGEHLDIWQRVLTPNGSLYAFCWPEYAGRVEAVVAERFRVLNVITWAKAASRAEGSEKEALRCFFPASERIVFAEQYGADGSALRGSGWKDATAKLHAGVFEPIRAYLVAERDAAGITNRQVDEFLGTSGMSGHYFGASQWALPTAEVYAKLQVLFNADASNPEHLRREYEDLRREYKHLRREYEDLRREYEDLRRPFNSSKALPYTDVWNHRTVNAAATDGKHPAQKPLTIMADIVDLSSRRGDTVLDPFAGSGTTLRAAKDLGRKAIGIEIDERYCEIAAKRLGQEVLDFGAAS